MYHPIEVKAVSGYKIRIKYEDGTEGEVDFSHLVGKEVFQYWTDFQSFEKVKSGLTEKSAGETK